ncbi:MAG: prepilin peptidase [Lachnospiraceae bacterium]|nr:prepilin peptidase [Lachnospiraceae bacterium]
MIILLLLLLILSLAAFYDYKKGKIPNYLIVIGAIGGVFRLIILQDVFAIVGYTPGIILPLALFYPVYKIGGMGAGDLKIFSMLGIYFSFLPLCFCIFISMFLAALLSLVKMNYHHSFLERMEYLCLYLKKIITTGRLENYHESDLEKQERERIKVRLAVPILLAVLVTGGII